MQALAQAALFPVRVQVRPSLGHGQHPTHGQAQILLDASLRRSPSPWPARGLEPPKKGLGAPVAGCGGKRRIGRDLSEGDEVETGLGFEEA